MSPTVVMEQGTSGKHSGIAYVDTSFLIDLLLENRRLPDGYEFKVTRSVVNEFRSKANRGDIPRRFYNFVTSPRFEIVEDNVVDEGLLRHIRETYAASGCVKKDPIEDTDLGIMEKAVKDSERYPETGVVVLAQDKHIRDTVPGLGVPNLQALTLSHYMTSPS